MSGLFDGRYRIEREIGRGGMGYVVEAYNPERNIRVAIKFLQPEALRAKGIVERFLREGRAVSRIQSDHVARVLDVARARETGAPYIVMEYLEGRSLAEVLAARGALPIVEVVDYVVQALEALAAAHASGVIHRDLKPANLFLTARRDGSTLVKVLDFGVSKLGEANASDEASSITKSSVLLGTPWYVSPEQFVDARGVDTRTDIWSIGVVLYLALTNTLPFDAPSLAILGSRIISEPPAPLRATRPEIPEALERSVLRCLAKDPNGRWASVADLAFALAAFGPPSASLSASRAARALGHDGAEDEGPTSSDETKPIVMPTYPASSRRAPGPSAVGPPSAPPAPPSMAVRAEQPPSRPPPPPRPMVSVPPPARARALAFVAAVIAVFVLGAIVTVAGWTWMRASRAREPRRASPSGL